MRLDTYDCLHSPGLSSPKDSSTGSVVPLALPNADSWFARRDFLFERELEEKALISVFWRREGERVGRPSGKESRKVGKSYRLELRG